ncbi:MAG: nitrile hydratase accessory protein [Salinarimonadaceae bacterium]|nr:MAG: nitrile hydratase accessory protein [Salinarimonadaceae bacterium]
MNPPDDVFAAAAKVAPIPVGADGPVFSSPWEAQAFAMTLRLHERGLFTWREWAQALAEAIRKAQAAGDADDGSTYYAHWLAALETLVAEKGLAPADALAERRAALERAARATPHGQPILLENDPLGRR